MEYQKYLKYKTKYLQLKAKLTQLGGAFRWVVEDQSNKPINDTDSALIQQQYLAGNSNIFSLRPKDYRYRLNIGSRTGVRINNLNQEIFIKQTDLATLDEFLERQTADFPNALSEIQAGKKKGHWIWWILPSEIGESENALKYALGPNATVRGSISIATYLQNDTLRGNYLIIIRAIYDHLKKNMSKAPKAILIDLLSSETDYAKFKNSFNNFYPELKKVVDSTIQAWLDDLHKILNLSAPSVAPATFAAFSPPGGQAASFPSHVMESREFREFGKTSSPEPPSKPIPSVNLEEAKDIIRKYVNRFKKKNLTVNEEECAEILAAKNTIDKNEPDPEKKLSVNYLYEFAQEFKKGNHNINDWFGYTLKVLSNY